MKTSLSHTCAEADKSYILPTKNFNNRSHGKICYLEIPALDLKVSADFYATVFNWRIRTRDDGSTAFDDGVGEVSGT